MKVQAEIRAVGKKHGERKSKKRPDDACAETSSENKELYEMMDEIVQYIMRASLNVHFLSISPKREETWKIEDVRKHWVLRSHCENLMFPLQYPSLALPSQLGRYSWQMHCSSGIPTPHYKKVLTRCVKNTVTSMNVFKAQMTYFILCDTMFNINWLDYHQRTAYMNGLLELLRNQDNLIMVSLENARLERDECMRILNAIGKNCWDTVKRMYLWKTMKTKADLNKGVFYSQQTPENRSCFKNVLSMYRNLTVLAVNYSYLTGGDADTILSLGSVTEGCFQDLQLLCLEEDLAEGIRQYDLGYEGFIPNSVWKKALEKCPGMKVHLVILCIPEEELSRKFLSPCMPLCSFHLSTGIDARRHKIWHIDCTLKLLSHWFSDSLECLALHMWQNRDVLDGMLFKERLAMFPNLKVFEFTGSLHDENSLHVFCQNLVDCEGSSLKKIRIMLHESPSKEDSGQVREKMNVLKTAYQDGFKEKELDVEFGTYRC